MAGYASVAIVEPVRSDYRDALDVYGYDRRGLRQSYAFEGGTLFRLGSRLSVGPFGRALLARFGAPYAGVPPIDVYAFSVAARVELAAFFYPRIFLWGEPTLGAAAIVATSHTTVGTWGLRGGIGLAGPLGDSFALRLRLGYALEPSLAKISAAGKMDFGGWIIALEGVFGHAP